MAVEERVVVLPDSLTVRELADSIDISVIEVMKVLIANGIVASINQQIDFDTASIVCSEFEIEALSQSSLAELAEKEEAAQAQQWRQIYIDEKPENLKRRPPIVTILGPRGPRQDDPAGHDPQGACRRRRGRRHHAAHRRLPRAT